MMVGKLFWVLLSLPKSIYFNFKYLGIKDGWKIPVLISYNTYLMETRGRVLIEGPLSFGMVRIGFGGIGLFDKRNRTIWHVYSGTVRFNDGIRIGYGSKISVTNGCLIIGKNVRITASTQIACNKKICIGDDSLISWDNIIMDTD